jgi:hypothetical protein
MEIILTVPHSVCYSRDLAHLDHLCDHAALVAAYEIKSNLDALGVKTWLEPADMNRRRLDLNRLESRHTTGFRQRIRDRIEGSRKTLKMVLDIHSYPEQYDQWSNYDIAILEDRKPMDGLPAASMHKWLGKNKITSTYVQGVNNDIQDEVHELGFESFLIEFNEGMLNDDDPSTPSREISRISLLIAKWVANEIGK